MDFFSIKRELKVITHTKVKLLKIFIWMILTWIDINSIQIFCRNPGDLERKLLFLFLTLSIKFLCYLFQCGLDLWIVAQAYVYFEKLILKVCYNYHNLILQNNLQDITHFSFWHFMYNRVKYLYLTCTLYMYQLPNILLFFYIIIYDKYLDFP